MTLKRRGKIYILVTPRANTKRKEYEKERLYMGRKEDKRREEKEGKEDEKSEEGARKPKRRKQEIKRFRREERK